ncbi:MAG TPA: Ig-like domain-containing protein [Candidatus Limnocylindria bacterium]|nr:Ig-like domain-containing protein [Candidatus Limnocylindria bacterium]
MLLRSLAVLVVGAAVLGGILYYASTVDSRAPAVGGFSLTQHLSGDTAVALTSTSLEVKFSEPVDEPTAEAAFRVDPAVEGSFSWSDSTMTFTPLEPLPPKTEFSAHVEPGVRDEAGNQMTQASASFVFTTVGEPQVVESDPATDATDVALDASLVITFSTLMDTRSVTGALELSPAFAHDLRWSGEQLTIAPRDPLSPNRRYTLTIGEQARDLGGTPLAAPFSLSFTTVEAGLSVGNIVPADDSDGIAVTSPIVVEFDRPLDPDSVSNDLLTISPQVAGNLDVIAPPGAAGLSNGDARLLRFQPSGPLPPNTTFTVTLAPGLRGSDGALMVSPLTWTFLTGAPMATLGNQVVYLSDRSGIANLWAMNPDGTGQRQLSAELSPVVDYAIAPDGRSFVVADGARLVEQRADGTSRRVLTDEGLLEFDPSYSPNGAQIAFGRADAATRSGLGLWVRDAGGGDAHRLEMPPELTGSPPASPADSDGEPASLLRAPRFSPDGHALAFVDETGRVGVLELPGDRLTTAPFRTMDPPVWLADSSGLMLDGLLGPSATRPPRPGEAVAPLALEAAQLSSAQLGQLEVVRLDRGANAVVPSGLPVGVARPVVDAAGRLAYLLLDPGRRAGAAWITRLAGGPGRSLLVEMELSAVRFTPDPDRLLLAAGHDGPDAPGGIWLFDVSNGSTRHIGDDGWMPRWVP